MPLSLKRHSLEQVILYLVENCLLHTLQILMVRGDFLFFFPDRMNFSKIWGFSLCIFRIVLLILIFCSADIGFLFLLELEAAQLELQNFFPTL